MNLDNFNELNYRIVGIEGDVGTSLERPDDVEGALVELQQEDDQNEEGVAHEEEEDGLVSQFNQIGCDSRLNRCTTSSLRSCSR